MADINISGINLNITGTYSAEYVPVPIEEQPSECTLPSFTTLSEVPTGITLPEITCKTQFPDPIAVPDICAPSFSGSIKFAECENASNAASTSGSVTLVPDGCCGFRFDGELSVCVPCIPTFESEVKITGECGTTVDVTSPITLAAIETDEAGNVCKYELQGEIAISSPETDVDISITVGECSDEEEGIENVLTINPVKAFGIEEEVVDGKVCGYKIVGDLELCAPVKCAAGYTTTVDIEVIDIGAEESSPAELTFKLGSPENPCELSLEGSIEVFCKSGIEFSLVDTPITFETPDGSKVTKKLTGMFSRVGCEVSLEMEALSFKLPGSPETITVCKDGEPEEITIWKFPSFPTEEEE